MVSLLTNESASTQANAPAGGSVEQPLSTPLGELKPPNLLADIDHECIGRGDLHLVLNQGAVHQGLDHVARMSKAS